MLGGIVKWYYAAFALLRLGFDSRYLHHKNFSTGSHYRNIYYKSLPKKRLILSPLFSFLPRSFYLIMPTAVETGMNRKTARGCGIKLGHQTEDLRPGYHAVSKRHLHIRFNLYDTVNDSVEFEYPVQKIKDQKSG